MTVSLCPPQTLHDPIWNRILGPQAGGRRLTTSAADMQGSGRGLAARYFRNICLKGLNRLQGTVSIMLGGRATLTVENLKDNSGATSCKAVRLCMRACIRKCRVQI
jgi:hypothetical protein